MRSERRNELRRGWVIPKEKIQTISRCSNYVSLEYQPPLGLDVGLLQDRVLNKELIGGRECRVVIDIRVPPLSGFGLAGRSFAGLASLSSCSLAFRPSVYYKERGQQ